MNNRRHGLYPILSISSIILILILCAGCGDDSNPAGGGATARDYTLPLNGALSNIQLLANQPTQVEFTLQAPDDAGMIKSVEIDVLSSMQHINLSTTKKMSKLDWFISLVTQETTGRATVKIGSDPETVCYENIVYGPYDISTSYFTDPDPVPGITLDDSTISILNYGFVSLCLELVLSEDATLSIDQIDARITDTDCGTPSNFAGSWRGTYTCGNSCGDSFGDSVFITVTQNGHTASYTDHVGDTYTGRVCGNEFRFKRINSPDEEEWGTLVLSDASHATKRSTWRTTDSPYCQGDCIDYLERLPQGD